MEERAPPVPSKEKPKPILIYVSRVANPKEAQSCKSDRPRIGSWLIIKHTAAGPEISNIFENIPEDEPGGSLDGASCAFIGSTLYVLGGRRITSSGLYASFNRVRRLDTQNLADGWKTSYMPFRCAEAWVTVSGNRIYLFPQFFSILPTARDRDCYPADIFGLVYDPVKLDAVPIKAPSHSSMCTLFSTSVSDSKLIVPLTEESWRNWPKVYLYDTCHKSWEKLENYHPFPTHSSVNDFCISNGILYFCRPSELSKSYTGFILSGHDIRNGRLLFMVQLPKLFGLDVNCSKFLVPIADFKLFLLWHINVGPCTKLPLCYAELWVSLDPSPTIYILNKGQLEIDAVEVQGCLPFDSYPGQNEEEGNSLSLREAVDEINKENLLKLKHINMKGLSLDILEKNERLKKTLKFLKQELSLTTPSSGRRQQ